MGYLVNSVCYETTQEAVNAFFSLQPVEIIPASTSHFSLFQNVAGVWKLSKYTVSNAGSVSLNYSTNVPVPSFSACVFEAVNVPFDPVLAAAYWSFALTFSLGCYLLAKNAGMILQSIKKF